MARSRKKKLSPGEKLLDQVRRDGQGADQRRQEAAERARRFADVAEFWGQLKAAVSDKTNVSDVPGLAATLVKFVGLLKRERLLRHLAKVDAGEGDTEYSRRSQMAVETYRMADDSSAKEMGEWLDEALAANPTTAAWFLEVLVRKIPFTILEAEWPWETREHIEEERNLERQRPVATPSVRDDQTRPTPEGRRRRRVAKTRRRPKYERDHLWLSWYEAQGSDTYCSPANIRDRWNRDHPTDAIADGEKGCDVVNKALRRARSEPRATMEK